ncbi:MAG: glucose-6-phosphate dehydrogenase, partial [Gemmatimonadales bacterium]
VEQIAEAGLTQQENASWRRVIIEKPFGTDLASARALDKRLLKVLDESQIYRMDHFLGKETVQNIMVLRFANGIFEPLWNRDHIDHVQITVAETVGVERRASFYEATGALKDMVPNHVFQLLSLTAMEPPNSFGADAVRTEKDKVLEAVLPLTGEDALRNVVRGQYTAGIVRGHPVKAYREADGVAPDSTTETYIAMQLGIDNWRWAGVPFYLRTGKRLAETRQRVSLILREPAGPLAGQLPSESNVLSFSLAGDGEIDLSLVVKKPGPELDLDRGTTSLLLSSLAGADPLPPYVRLIHDALIGDRSLFTRPDGLAATWKVASPLLSHPPRVAPYAPGSWGPAEAAKLIAPGRWLLGQ